MSINKFITNLDLARQAEILSGETAVFQGGMQLGIPFSGFPSGVDTNTIVSLGVIETQYTAFSGGSGTTIFDIVNPSSPYYSVSAVTISASPYTVLDSGTITETVSATTYPIIMTFTALSGDCCSTPISATFNPPVVQELYDRGLYNGLFNGLGQATIGDVYSDLSFYNDGSVFSGASINMEIINYGVHGTTPAWVTGTTSGTVIEYSGLSQYWSNPIYSSLTSGLTLPISPISSDTQTSNYIWTLTDSTIIDENLIGLQYTGYNVTYSFENVQDEPTTQSYVIGGVYATLEYFSASTLDYKDSVRWLKVRGNAEVDERLTTDRMTIHTLGTGSPVTMLAVDINGNVVGGTGGTTDDTGAFTSTTENNTIIPTNAAGNTNDSDFASILGGQNNTISGTSTSSSIVGGDSNIIDNSDQSSIIGGNNNILINSDRTLILGGQSNTGSTHFDSLLSGRNNEMTYEGLYNILLGGLDNVMGTPLIGLTGPTYASSILGGSGNLIYENVSDSSILGGRDNTIEKFVRRSSIIGGSGNTNTHDRSVILGGQGITSSANDTAYVPNLNIGTLGGGASVNNLGIDASGNVVSGNTGSFLAAKAPEAISGDSLTAKGIPDGQVISGYTDIRYNNTDISGTLTTPFGTFDNTTGIFTTNTDCVLNIQAWIHLKANTASDLEWETGTTATQIGLGICPNNTTDIYVGDFLTILPSVSRGLDITTGITQRVLSGTTFRVKILNQTSRSYPGPGTVSGDYMRFSITRVD